MKEKLRNKKRKSVRRLQKWEEVKESVEFENGKKFEMQEEKGEQEIGTLKLK